MLNFIYFIANDFGGRFGSRVHRNPPPDSKFSLWAQFQYESHRLRQNTVQSVRWTSRKPLFPLWDGGFFVLIRPLLSSYNRLLWGSESGSRLAISKFATPKMEFLIRYLQRSSRHKARFGRSGVLRVAMGVVFANLRLSDPHG